MEEFEVTQALMTVGTTYEVRRPQASEVLYLVKGELMSPTPKFHLLQGDKTLADLSANFMKTKYEIAKDGKAIASLTFPAVAFKKTLTLTTGGKAYDADGGVFKGVFQCKDDGGNMVLEIAKALSIRDTFHVKTTGTLALEIGLLSAVAIHSRFYEMV